MNLDEARLLRKGDRIRVYRTLTPEEVKARHAGGDVYYGLPETIIGEIVTVASDVLLRGTHGDLAIAALDNEDRPDGWPWNIPHEMVEHA